MTTTRSNTVSTAHTYQPQTFTASNFPVPQALPQTLQVSAPTSNAEYEALRNQAHEAYRAGDFHRALQLCQMVGMISSGTCSQMCSHNHLQLCMPHTPVCGTTCAPHVHHIVHHMCITLCTCFASITASSERDLCYACRYTWSMQTRLMCYYSLGPYTISLGTTSSV